MSTVKEDFLINPPKRKRRAKAKAERAFGGLGGAHRPLVFGPKGGPWKRSHRSKRKLATLQNPFGESLMIAGLNPKRRKRHNPKHRKTMGFARLFDRHNAPGRRRHYGARRKHNPAGVLAPLERMAGFDFPTLGQFAGFGVGAVVTASVPRMVNMTGTPFKKYGVEFATVIGGGFALNMIPFSPKVPALKGFAGGFVTGGFGWIAAELVRDFVLPNLPFGWGARFKDFGTYQPGLPAFGPGYQGYEGYEGLESYEPLNGLSQLNDSGLGAFPIGDSGFGAFPGDGGAYDMTGTPFTPGEGTSVY
jgi:hypothetical protein